MMSSRIIWQQGSSNPDQVVNFNTICEWWGNLNHKEVAWAQRLIPEDPNLDHIDWETQRFDEKFTIQTPEIRGITLYWYKLGDKDERNLTPKQLELDLHKEQLYIYPASQAQVVIRVVLPQVKYQVVDLNNPQIAANPLGKNCLFLLRDPQQQLEVKLNLSPEKQLYLLSILAKNLQLDAQFNLSPEKLNQLLENLSK
jgi:hypothetical protein